VLRLLPLLLLLSCAEPAPEPTEFERHCLEVVRDILPDVHAALGESIGRPVRIVERSLFAGRAATEDDYSRAVDALARFEASS